MIETFSTLTEAITAVFRREETSLLSLDKICQVLQTPNLTIATSQGPVPCASISRRRISSILSSSDIFVRAGPPRSCMWALRPSNPLFLSDGALLNCINQILTENGPLTVEGILEKGDLSGATVQIITDFLMAHPNDYSRYESGIWWFTAQPLPQRMEFESVISALLKAFEILNRDSSIEEISWLLCLSTLSQNKKISRRKISRELSRRPDLFQHISRAKYALIPQNQTISNMSTMSNSLSHQTMNIPQQTLSTSKSLPQKQQTISLPQFPNFELMYEVPAKFDFIGNDWMCPIQQCETPPVCNNDFFDPNEFFSIGFAGSFE